jgi:signal transduction histidine kinase
MTETDKHSAAVKTEEATSPAGTLGENIPGKGDGEEKLRAVVADYQARMDEVADLITRVRHEINNPLTGVLGQAQLLLREELNERARKRAETIEGLAIRIRDIVAQLRQIQKPSRS